MRSLFILLSAFLFTIVADSSDCQAQLFGSRRAAKARSAPPAVAPPIWFQPAGHVGSYVPQNLAAKPVFPVEDYYTTRHPKISRILDGPMTHKYRNPAEVDARYIGGFHQSYFQNVGIPSGDIGIRGNAYNWRTW